MCQAFADQGHAVLLAAAAGEDSGDVVEYYGLRGGFDLALKRFPALLKGRLARSLRLRELLLALHHRWVVRSFRPSLVYSRLAVAELVLLPRDLPVIYEMHSLGPLGRGGLKGLLFRWLLRCKYFRRIIVTTDALAGMLRERLPGVEVVVARLGAEPPVQVDAVALQAFRAEHLQGHRFSRHVGYTGNLDTVGLRGTEVICRCAAALPDVAFHVVGGDAESVAYWRMFAGQNNTHGNLFFYDHRNPAEMPFFLACFDVVMAPLQWKPSRTAPIGAGMSPLKLPQYMAYRKAIIASDIPSHREILEDGSTALLVQCDDTDAWVTAINKLLADSVLRERIGDAGHRSYMRNFTASGRVRTVLQGLDAGHG